jgi:hypothetical protein
MLEFAQKLWRRKRPDPAPGFYIQRPLVLLQSDDWGRVGVRDKEGYDLLREAGLRLGEHPYDFYTLETAGDVNAVSDLLKKHTDSTGRSPCMAMNFVMSNLDFPSIASDNYKKIHLLPLTDGLPGNWKRPGLFPAYEAGIEAGVFYPSLHGLTHFCQSAIANAIAKNSHRSQLLASLWKAETPYIYWRMPWIGYEYHNPERPQAGFLSAGAQDKQIAKAVEIFKKCFSCSPASACAPGYRANADTHLAWSKHGIRVVQDGSGPPSLPHIDDFEILNLHRTIDFEPSQKDLPLEKYIQLAGQCFARGVPAVISVHSINFHSSLKDFRTPTLHALNDFLTALERKFPNLLYVHDMDVYEIIKRGKFRSAKGVVPVAVKRQETISRS